MNQLDLLKQMAAEAEADRARVEALRPMMRSLAVAADIVLANHLASVEPVRPRCSPACARWVDTLTIWPGETFQRMTQTCAVCGAIRGRA